MLVNLALVVLVIVVSGPDRRLATVRQAIGPFDDVALEFATLAMGALVAAAANTFGPPYVLLGLPPLIVLHRTRLVRQLEQDASTDGKTGLLTAAAWQDKAGQAVLRSERGDRPASVLVLDLDHFKLVNDRFGHLVGDQVLAAVAASVRDEVRDEDLVGRFGGEEFVVLLRGADGEDPRSGARAVAERIRERIAALRVAVAGPQETAIVEGLTVSIGGATTSRDGTDLATLLEIADAAMYEAKRAGRNLVRMGVPLNIPPQLRRVDRT
jgi:diguanylate cyclase (GGDEF)-like protein